MGEFRVREAAGDRNGEQTRRRCHAAARLAPVSRQLIMQISPFGVRSNIIRSLTRVSYSLSLLRAPRGLIAAGKRNSLAPRHRLSKRMRGSSRASFAAAITRQLDGAAPRASIASLVARDPNVANERMNKQTNEMRRPLWPPQTNAGLAFGRLRLLPVQLGHAPMRRV